MHSQIIRVKIREKEHTLTPTPTHTHIVMRRNHKGNTVTSELAVMHRRSTSPYLRTGVCYTLCPPDQVRCSWRHHGTARRSRGNAPDSRVHTSWSSFPTRSKGATGRPLGRGLGGGGGSGVSKISACFKIMRWLVLVLVLLLLLLLFQ